MTDTRAEPREERGRERRLWAGFLLAPVAWGASLGIGYSLVAVGCRVGWMLAVTIVGALMAAAGTMMAFREYRRLAGSEGPEPDRVALPSVPYDYRHGVRARQRLMSKVGWVTGALMVAAIIAHGVAFAIMGCR